MRAIYNGVDLMPLETHYFDWESVYDDSGVDYLYSRVSFASRSVVNGIASVVPVANGPPMNYALDDETTLSTPAPSRSTVGFTPAPNVPPDAGLRARSNSTYRTIILNPAGGGVNGTQSTHQAVRYRLQVPRGKLYLFWGAGMESGSPPAGALTPPPTQNAKLFLESPGPDSKVDCKNGPIPRLFNVMEAFGDATTLIVDWGVETYVNEASVHNVRSVGSLLSNRFHQTHSVASDGYTSITTEGSAIFRTDLVYDIPNSPDAFRAIAFMPIPQGFTREILYVTGRPDVTGVDYGYRDTQMSVNFVAGPFVKAASISCVHRQAVSTRPDLWGGALSAYERVLGIKANRNIARSDDARRRNAGRPNPANARKMDWVPGMRPPRAPEKK